MFHNSASISLPYTHPQPLHIAGVVNLSALFSIPALFCCMLTLAQLLRRLNLPDPSLFADLPASAVLSATGQCFILMKYS